MKNTRVNVEEQAKKRGYDPVQIDGIPEGFSFQAPTVRIADVVHEGQFIAFIPNTEDGVVWAYDAGMLLELYNLEREKYAKQRSIERPRSTVKN